MGDLESKRKVWAAAAWALAGCGGVIGPPAAGAPMWKAATRVRNTIQVQSNNRSESWLLMGERPLLASHASPEKSPSVCTVPIFGQGHASCPRWFKWLGLR